MNQNWANNSIFYHIYPLGMFGALYKNDYKSRPISRIKSINDWIDYLKDLNITGLYLGPLFESEYHGYETVDYNIVDRRLGTNEDLKEIVYNLHSNNIKVILDGVFNHCGRDFWAFKDLLINKKKSTYKEWFYEIDFNTNNRYNDGFNYSGWNNHLSLIKFNHENQYLREYLFGAIKNWIEYFDIDGLRLDAADYINIEFLKKLSKHCKNIKKNFWLMGEVIHGDYNKWVNPITLDSVTNYEFYKSLFSSHNDSNYFEIAYSLNRQFGKNGIYKDLYLYNFVDNHDVERIASILKNKHHLYPLHILLFTIPGIPSLYYGSEVGIEGKKTKHSDDNLRPVFLKDDILSKSKHPDLIIAIKKLGKIRNKFQALNYGNYEELLLSHKYLVFKRMFENQTIIIAVNSDQINIDIELSNISEGNILKDILNNNEVFNINNGKVKINMNPNWGRIMILK